ncbi:MAG: hypothetical protein ACLFN5_01705 [bacterium]
MIKNEECLKIFEQELLKKQKMSLEEKFKLMDDMHRWALKTGAFSAENALEGIEVDKKIARVVNSV